jgi:hypothetical protein
MLRRCAVARLTFPEPVWDSLARLGEFQETEFEKLTAAIDATPAALRSPARLYGLLADRAELPLDLVSDVLMGVMTIAATAAREGLSPEAAMIDLASERPDVDQMARARLSRLLRAPLVQITVRALNIALADERLLARSRIVTDVRPIFPVDRDLGTALEPQAAVITHSLRLEYHEAGEIRAFVVGLDDLDIVELQRALQRAERKAAALKALLERASLPYVGLDPAEVGE